MLNSLCLVPLSPASVPMQLITFQEKHHEDVFACQQQLKCESADWLFFFKLPPWCFLKHCFNFFYFPSTKMLSESTEASWLSWRENVTSVFSYYTVADSATVLHPVSSLSSLQPVKVWCCFFSYLSHLMTSSSVSFPIQPWGAHKTASVLIQLLASDAVP